MRRRAKKSLRLENLEPRHLLSASGLVPVGQQPEGGLSGKIVYTHGGHGWTADNLGNGAWTTQRPETFELVEDLGNIDQMTFFADYLFRAGATVVPLRPVGHQTNEVVLDNDDPEVTFFGNWSNSVSSVYFGDAGDLPYRFASTSTTETAHARYRPDIPEAGFYPVYSWTRRGTDRATDHLYRIHHTGGITEVTVNHQMVGSGTVYLGTYYFDAGTDGYVDISNRSNGGGSVVIADMIRFGNGMGDIDRGGGVSGLPREDEAGLYWVKWHVDNSQGIPDSEYRATSNDRDATVSLSPRYAEYMNDSGSGVLSDRVFVSFHSNAGGGSARGVLGLYNGNNNPATATPNQFFLADTLAEEINTDLVALNGQFEHNWFDRSTVTLDRSDIEFGEINNLRINNEFDATIIETGFHDNQQDAEMLRDPKVRDALARATYQGLVKYFRTLDPTVPSTDLPGPVSGVRAEAAAEGEVTLSWELPTLSGAVGGLPTGYRIYTSLDGYGFDGGTLIPGAGITSFTLTGLDASEGMHYFKIAPVNAGGEAPASEVVAAWPAITSDKVLVVNGFDRFDRFLNRRTPYFAGTIDRVTPRLSNSFDYTVQVGHAIEAYANRLQVDSTANEAIVSGSIALADYDAVVWILGEESSADDTFDATEQALVTSYLAGGGKLFVSGAEIGWDLDNLNNGRVFYNSQLRADYVSDDANTYNVQGNSSSIFTGLSFTFDDGELFYDAQFPDRITPINGSTAAMTYIGGSGGTAAIQFGTMATTQVVMFGFPFETITSATQRANVMDRVLDFFGIPTVSGVVGDFDNDGDLDCDDVDALTAEIAAGGMNLLFDVNGSGSVTIDDLDSWIIDQKGTLHGDANLDMAVDGLDFDIWNTNKFTNTGAWCSADFNADGITNGRDFLIWNANKFSSPDVAPVAPFAVGPVAVVPVALGPSADSAELPEVAKTHLLAGPGVTASAYRVPSYIPAIRSFDRDAAPARIARPHQLGRSPEAWLEQAEDDEDLNPPQHH